MANAVSLGLGVIICVVITLALDKDVNDSILGIGPVVEQILGLVHSALGAIDASILSVAGGKNTTYPSAPDVVGVVTVLAQMSVTVTGAATGAGTSAFEEIKTTLEEIGDIFSGDDGSILATLHDIRHGVANLTDSLEDVQGGVDESLESAASAVSSVISSFVIIVLLLFLLQFSFMLCNKFCKQGSRPRDKTFFGCLSGGMTCCLVLWFLLIWVVAGDPSTILVPR